MQVVKSSLSLARHKIFTNDYSFNKIRLLPSGCYVYVNLRRKQNNPTQSSCHTLLLITFQGYGCYQREEEKKTVKEIRKISSSTSLDRERQCCGVCGIILHIKPIPHSMNAPSSSSSCSTRKVSDSDGNSFPSPSSSYSSSSACAFFFEGGLMDFIWILIHNETMLYVGDKLTFTKK